MLILPKPDELHVAEMIVIFQTMQSDGFNGRSLERRFRLDVHRFAAALGAHEH